MPVAGRNLEVKKARRLIGTPVGVSPEETVAGIAQLSNPCRSAEHNLAMLRRAMATLLNSSEKFAETIDRFGMKIRVGTMADPEREKAITSSERSN